MSAVSAVSTMSTTKRPLDIALVGRGRVGRTLALRLGELGHRVRLVRGRDLAASRTARAQLREADVIWLTVPDPHLPRTIEALSVILDPAERSARASSGPVVAHASGSIPADVLGPLSRVGASVAAAHPIVSFGTTKTEVRGATFVISGEARATRVLTRLVRELGARPVVRALQGARYHAALAFAANGATALAALASNLLTASEPALEPREAAWALASLLRSVADNIARVGPLDALTGPIVRGDARTVERHLAALDRAEREDYAAVARIVLRAARLGGLEEARASEIERALDAGGEAPRRRSRPQRSAKK